jgi:hypothetical protein
MTALSGVTPTWVHPLEPQFSIIITQAEGGKKQYQNLSPTPLIRWKLIWKGLSDTKFWTLHKHFIDHRSGTSKFAWKDVPSYIDTNNDGVVDGSDVTVRYVVGTFRFQPDPYSWNGEVVLEKDV